jgi:hypothetical protein
VTCSLSWPAGQQTDAAGGQLDRKGPRVANWQRHASAKAKAAKPSEEEQGKTALRSGRSRRRSRVVGLGREMRRLAPEIPLAACACWRRGCLGAALPCQCPSHSRQPHDTYLIATTTTGIAGRARSGGKTWRGRKGSIGQGSRGQDQDAEFGTVADANARVACCVLHFLDRHV